MAPPKPLVEMNDAELRAWHSRHRDHANPQTMVAHVNAVGVKPVGAKKTAKKQDVSDFV